MEIDGTIYLGQVAAFYVPVQKLDSAHHTKNGQTPRQLFDTFLMSHYDAYTLALGDIEGFWREHPESPIIRDENARYEVSFHGDIQKFISFLSEMCLLIEEQAIYLTMGYQSWLILPREQNEI